MNIQMLDTSGLPVAEEPAKALSVLRAWVSRASEAEIAALDPGLLAWMGQGYPVLSRDYPAEFRADAAYKAGLPDLQNGPASLIVGVAASGADKTSIYVAGTAALASSPVVTIDAAPSAWPALRLMVLSRSSGLM